MEASAATLTALADDGVPAPSARSAEPPAAPARDWTGYGPLADAVPALTALPGDTNPEGPLQSFDLPRRLVAEALGTAILVAIGVGTGIMGERLAGGNAALMLLASALATGAGLAVLITVLGPLSGGHINPAVTLAFALRRELGARDAALYVTVQVLGGVLGAWAAHLMFEEPVLQIAATLRDGPAQAFSEGLATFGLIFVVLGSLRFRPEATPAMAGLYIAAAFWFTASTSFANPVVTLARVLSDTPVGIAPASAPAFILAQLAGAAAATALGAWLFRR